MSLSRSRCRRRLFNRFRVRLIAFFLLVDLLFFCPTSCLYCLVVVFVTLAFTSCEGAVVVLWLFRCVVSRADPLLFYRSRFSCEPILFSLVPLHTYRGAWYSHLFYGAFPCWFSRLSFRTHIVVWGRYFCFVGNLLFGVRCVLDLHHFYLLYR